MTFTDTNAGTVDLNGTSQPTSGSLPGLTFNNATAGYTVQNGTISTNGAIPDMMQLNSGLTSSDAVEVSMTPTKV